MHGRYSLLAIITIALGRNDRRNRILNALLYRAFGLIAIFLVAYSDAGAQRFDRDLLDQLSSMVDGPGSLNDGAVARRNEIKNERLKATLSPESSDLPARGVVDNPKLSRLQEDVYDRTGVFVDHYGYDIVRKAGSGLSDVGRAHLGAVGADYELGIGDGVTVSILGTESNIFDLVVDSEGRLVVPSIGSLAAAGRSLGNIRDELSERIKALFVGAEVFVSLSELRRGAVYVTGEVGRPGVQHVVANASLIEVLRRAGGVRYSGSLRNIQIKRRDQIFSVDLYDYLTGQRLSTMRSIQHGDTIFVPTLRATIALISGVNRPAIYELPANRKALSAAEAIQLAGGPIRSRGNKIVLSRLDDTGVPTLEAIENPRTFIVQSGDVVAVRLPPDTASAAFSVAGAVNRPGRYSLFEYAELGDLVRTPGFFTASPYTLFAVVGRVQGITKTRRWIPVNLEKLGSHQEVFELKSRDSIVVFDIDDIRFLDSEPVQRVLKRYAQGRFTDQASAETQSSSSEDNSRSPNQSPTSHLLRLTVNPPRQDAVAAESGGAREADKGGTTAVGVTNDATIYSGDQRKATRTRAYSVRGYPNATLSQRVSDCAGIVELARILNTEDGFRFAASARLASDGYRVQSGVRGDLFCPEPYSVYPELLPLVVEHITSLNGAVRRPGSYPLVGDVSVETLVTVAGGFTRDANLTSIRIARTQVDTNNLEGRASRLKFSAIDSPTSQSDQSILPGDFVTIDSYRSDIEPRPVLISGEVKNAGFYEITRGERLSSVLRRASGLTPQAYPYGAVFTRESIKREDEAWRQRSLRDLRESMIQLAGRGRSRGVGIGDIGEFYEFIANQLTQAPLVGRLVVEADPAVLAVRASRDIVLEGGDRLVYPKRPVHVTVSGEVLNPGAVPFVSNHNVADYIESAGGITRSADLSQAFVVMPDGTAKALSLASWQSGGRVKFLPPGSAIVVPRDPLPFDYLTFAIDISDILSKLAISAASIATINDD